MLATCVCERTQQDVSQRLRVYRPAGALGLPVRTMISMGLSASSSRRFIVTILERPCSGQPKLA
jgi:hypothetical protein